MYLGLGLQQNFWGNTTQPTPCLDLRRNRCPLCLPSASYCCCSFATSCLTLCNPMASLSFTISPSWLKLLSSESVMPSILCCPLLLLPSIVPSIRVFSSESVLHIRWPKYLNFSFNISPSSEHSGPICLRMDWLNHLAVQGTLKSFLQYYSWKASILALSLYGPTLISIHDYWKNHRALSAK